MLGSLLMGLGGQALGGVAGALGNKMSEWISGESSSEAQTNLMNQLMQQGTQNNRSDVLSRMFNAAGQQGSQVGASHKMALDSLGQSTGALRDANALRSQADQMLSNANQQASATQMTTQNSLGNMRRDAMDAMRGTASPAAMAGALGKMGQGAAQAGSQMYAQNMQALNQAGAQAGGMRSAATEMLAKDLANRNQIYVKPYEAQVSGGSLADTAANQYGSVSSSVSRDMVANNPLAGIASGLGQLGTAGMMDWGKKFFEPESQHQEGNYSGTNPYLGEENWLSRWRGRNSGFLNPISQLPAGGNLTGYQFVD